jgi:CRP-like cAMP-binding protein
MTVQTFKEQRRLVNSRFVLLLFSFFLLSLSGKDEDNDDTGNLPLHLSREEIANILGLTTTTVCRVMTDFQRKAIIVAPRGSVRILDRMRLRLMSGDS